MSFGGSGGRTSGDSSVNENARFAHRAWILFNNRNDLARRGVVVCAEASVGRQIAASARPTAEADDSDQSARGLNEVGAGIWHRARDVQDENSVTPDLWQFHFVNADAMRRMIAATNP